MNKENKENFVSTTKNELLIYGFRAAKALWKHRPQDIVRIYCTEESVRNFGDALKWCATQKKAYHMVTIKELEDVTSSVHHEGIAMLAKMPEPIDSKEFLDSAALKGKNIGPLVFMDGVSNPHNLGAITRSMAHFGSLFLLGDAQELPRISSAWARLSEGGIEHIKLVTTTNKFSFLKDLKDKGFSLFAMSSHGKSSLYKTTLPEKSVFILGNEITGLSKDIAKLVSTYIAIPGTGVIDSLNVSASTAICLSEWSSQRGQGGV